ncbi:hypothetical protein AB1Y20_021743 [Prymnesium parvum]|uniref:SLC41A/MgtE integral membrane domain-containing protein n=1 Tax=Prymnesium parvum TaxID=97485 RepID=A0AB34JMD1_PRYPA
MYQGVASHSGGFPHDHGFLARLRPRAGLLVGLMIFQSCSSFILASYEPLLRRHPVLVFFMTMLVGAGGNAGNQAAVLVIRGIATGDITPRSQLAYVGGEARVALALSALMVAVGLARVLLFGYSLLDALAIGTSLFAIVTSSVVVGASLPILIQRLGFDPAHAGATIQVIMDLAGVLITCLVGSFVLSTDGEVTSARTG